VKLRIFEFLGNFSQLEICASEDFSFELTLSFQIYKTEIFVCRQSLLVVVCRRTAASAAEQQLTTTYHYK
jgi:hypothetical protein